MKKLFLLTFAFTLLCTWAVVAADVVPEVMLRSQKAVADQDKAAGIATETAQQRPLPQADTKTNLGSEGVKVEQEVEMGEATATYVPEKVPFEGPKNPPLEGAILQGGDDCATATPVDALPFSACGNTIQYNHDYNEVCPFTTPGAPDVVYSYTPEVDIAVDITLCVDGTDYDTKLYVYENECQPPDDDQDPYACNDDDCTSPQYPSPYVSALWCLQLYAGNTYYIIVDGYSTGSGNYCIDITECVPPTGACCVDFECVATNTEAECAGLGGDWYEGETCPEYQCPTVPDNDDCENPEYVGQPFPAEGCGSLIYATIDCPDLLAWNAVWYEIELPYECNNINIDFCPTSEDIVTVGIILMDDCLCDDYIVRDVGAFYDCASGYTGYNMDFLNIAGPGTILWPAYALNAGGGGMDFCWTIDVTECVPPTGACCVGIECVATNTQAECDALGGDWYEGQTCPEFQCPLPLPCWDGVNILWDNGDTDGSNGYSMTYGGRTILDDFVVPDGGMTISDFHQTYIWNSLPPGSGTGYILNIWSDAGGAPGEPIMSLSTALASELPTGRNYFGRDEAIGNVCVDPTYLEEGTYWLEMSAEGPENCFAMIHAYVTGAECWVNYPDLGGLMPGSQQFGVEADVNFCLTGDECTLPTGACCDDETGECVDNVLEADCPDPLRWGGPYSTCEDIDPPCTGPCPDAEIIVEIMTDPYPSETTWEIRDDGGNLIASGGPYDQSYYLYHHEICVDAGCYTFTVFDSYGDGQYSPGGYSVAYNGDIQCSTMGSGWSGYEQSCDVGDCPGACCVDLECVATNYPDECDALGGQHFIGETCPEFACPVPGCLDQPPNQSNGLFADYDWPQWCADNFVVSAPMDIYGFSFYGGYFPDDIPMEVDDFTIYIREDAGGVPGAALYAFPNIPATYREQTGVILFGVHEWYYEVCLGTIPLEPGVYWFEVNNATFPVTDVWFWETGDLDAENGVMGMAWGTTSDEGPWNSDGATDLAWAVLCQPCGDLFGACCDDATGECTDDVHIDDCPTGYRFVAGTLCADLQPPCGGPLGACCVEMECVATTNEGDCDALGGDWYEGQTCPEFQCPLPPLDCGDAVYDNGPDDFLNVYAAQCDPVYPFIVEVADDFVLDADYNITAITAAIGFWSTNPCQMDGVLGMTAVIYNDNGGIPGGTPGVGDCTHDGDVVWEQTYAPGEWTATDLGGPDGNTQIDLQTGGVALSGGVTYWLGIMVHIDLSACGQGGWTPTGLQVGSVPLLWSDYFGIYWTDPFGYGYDMNFCLHSEAGGNCGDYVIGDYNCSGTANVADVVDMYSKLKTGAPVYPDCECDCLGDGNIWPVGGDVNSSCAMNVADVVDLYSKLKTGSPELTPCMDCPPDSWLNPGGGDRPLVVPNLESKAKLKTGSGMD